MPGEVLFQGKKFQVLRSSSREFVLHPGAVAILPWVDEENLCMVRNLRVSVGETLLEIPAGTLDPGETPEQTARRELAEETGYRAATWGKLFDFYPSPGVLSERMFLFWARDLTPGKMDLQADETLQTEIVPFGQALSFALDGTIKDAKTLIALWAWEKLGL